MKKIKIHNVRKITWIWFVILLIWNIKIFMDLINHIENNASYFWGPLTLALTTISIIWQLIHEKD